MPASGPSRRAWTSAQAPAHSPGTWSRPAYGITADLLGRLLAAGTRLVAADLVLQRAVVRSTPASSTPDRGGGRGPTG